MMSPAIATELYHTLPLCCSPILERMATQNLRNHTKILHQQRNNSHESKVSFIQQKHWILETYFLKNWLTALVIVPIHFCWNITDAHVFLRFKVKLAKENEPVSLFDNIGYLADIYLFKNWLTIYFYRHMHKLFWFVEARGYNGIAWCYVSVTWLANKSFLPIETVTASSKENKTNQTKEEWASSEWHQQQGKRREIRHCLAQDLE